MISRITLMLQISHDIVILEITRRLDFNRHAEKCKLIFCVFFAYLGLDLLP